MYHARFKGTHYEIGYRFGASLAKQNRFILDNIPYPLSEPRRRFAESCLPAYQEHFPELLEEISGLAAGQRCDPAALEAFLLGMYALPPSCGCSCFAVSDARRVLLGRNSDFMPELEKLSMNVVYRFSDSRSNAFTGNTTALIEMEDGVNQHGLAAGLTYVPPASIRPGLNAGMLLRYILEKCRDVEDALKALDSLPIASAQTLILADARGGIALAECSAERLEVLRPTQAHPFVCAANHFASEEMSRFQQRGPDEWQSGARYATMTRALARGCPDVSAARNLLSGKEGFLCQYDRRTGTDTIWSVIYDLTGGKILRAEGNPGRRKFREDQRFAFL